MRLEALCNAAGIDYPRGNENTEITSVISDTRRCEAGCLFVCIKGLRTDAHRLIGKALQGGAIAVVTEEGSEIPNLPSEVILLQAKDTRRVLARMLDAFYGHPARRMKLIGVTGTNGKTSVTHMLKAILEAAQIPCGVIGTVGSFLGDRRLCDAPDDPLANMTTPDPERLYRLLFEMAEGGAEYVLMEVTSHALALGKVDPLVFEAAIFTNLTPDHLDFHKNMESYAEAKASLFQKCRLGIFNVDDPAAAVMQSNCAGRAVTCSTRRADADFFVEGEVMICLDGVRYQLASRNHRLRLAVPTSAEFGVINSLQAAACALELGIPATCVKDALAAMRGVKGRMERVPLGPGADFTVLIDYAHTPDALEKLLLTAKTLQRGRGRILLVFGCGGDRDRSKRSVMGRIAAMYADLVILTADNSRSERTCDILEQIQKGIPEEKSVTIEPDRARAIRHAVLTAGKGDLILLAGKGHEEYELTEEGRRPFHERSIVREAFEERRKREKATDTTETDL